MKNPTAKSCTCLASASAFSTELNASFLIGRTARGGIELANGRVRSVISIADVALSNAPIGQEERCGRRKGRPSDPTCAESRSTDAIQDRVVSSARRDVFTSRRRLQRGFCHAWDSRSAYSHPTLGLVKK